VAECRLDEVEIGARFQQRRREGAPEPVGRAGRHLGEHAPGHWVLEDSADIHYWRTEAAGQALEVPWNSPMAAVMFAELDAIHADRYVARIDVSSGEFHVVSGAWRGPRQV
jgi:hypothetical protein